MKDDYLWDGSGEPDPEIQRLETVLQRYRHNGPAPAFEAIAEIRPVKHRARFFNLRVSFQLGAVAAILLIAAGLSYLMRNPKPEANLGPAWDVARLEGTPRIERKAVGGNAGIGKIRVGQTLETDRSSRATITLDAIGRVDLEAGTRLRVVTNGPGRKRLALDRGTIHATIWAPPGEFVVDTPSAVAVDLGCVYTLQVDDSGAGLLRTTLGWVGFKLNGHESFIPAGAVCPTRPKIGPGTPYFEDATLAFREALSKLDLAATPTELHDLLGIILIDARKNDALTLWHLLARVSDSDRPRVYDRLATLAPPPARVTREGILRLDQPMLDSWWNSLGFGDVSLWRHWEHDWSQRPPTAR